MEVVDVIHWKAVCGLSPSCPTKRRNSYLNNICNLQVQVLIIFISVLLKRYKKLFSVLIIFISILVKS